MTQATPRTSTRARNWTLVQVDSVFIGIVTASGTFLPVFLLRLGGTANDVGLLTALPALTAFALAIPLGRWLQTRRNIVPWYSRMRLLAWLSYALIAGVAAAFPPEQAIPGILVVWALASLPSTAGLVAFPIVMDGAAGRDGRFDLLGRRWAIAGTSTAIAVALGGQFLNAVPFPVNFELLFVMVTLAGAGSFLQSYRIVIPDQAPRPSGPAEPFRQRLTGLWSLVLANRSFVRYELRSLAYTVAIGLSLPILPLFYVHEMAASDAWIGAIGAAQSAGGVLGYIAARQLARRRGPTTTLLPSMLAVALAPAILSATGWLPAVAMIAFVVGLASAGVQLAMFDQLMRRVPLDQGVTFSSVDQSVQNFALVLAPNIGGVIALALGARTALLIVALVGAVAFALFAWNARPVALTRARAVTERERDQPEAST
ncbi:MAG TPA: MFS transporter [Patescibacteria group bacterium]|nr:MFS transporter [Patescibacteria group bacterium]